MEERKKGGKEDVIADEKKQWVPEVRCPLLFCVVAESNCSLYLQ